MTTASSWVKIGKVSSIGEGVTSFRKRGQRVAVIKENGEILKVFSDHCPHNPKIMISSDYMLEDGVDGKKITCKHHGACFQVITGMTLMGPGKEGLKLYEFELTEKDELLVKLSD
ncbi:MAG: Rieske (2Fe-2S) protein [Candidatus Kariarchaeaceae archaeon]|jgi:nitrite reductase/ring-hydroxylating ferredoxin subunit